MSKSRFRKFGWMMGGAGAVLMLAASAAAAQQAAQPPAPTVEEIVVTSQKRSERLLDVPLAVSAINESALQAAGVANFTDYARSVPGLAFSDLGNGRQQPSIRGINVNIGAAVVGYYVDETPIPATLGTLRLSAIDPRLFDIDRVEVLRGPQGTLYGSGSMGGTIRIIPNRPDSSGFAGALRATGDTVAGGGLGGSIDGMLNLPIIQDKLALRLTGWDRQEPGFIERRASGVDVGKVPNESTGGGRAALEYKSGPLRLQASVFHQDQHFDGFQNVTFDPSNLQGDLVQNLIFDTPEENTNRFTLTNFTGEADLGFATFLSSTSYYRGGFRAAEDTAELLRAFIGPTFNSTIIEDSQQKSFTEEARLSSNHPVLGFDWIGGVFYSHGSSYRTDTLIVPEYTPIVGSPDLYSGVYVGHSTQKAAFGELTYHFTPALSLKVGGRYYDVSSDNSTVADGLFNGGPSVNGASSSATGAVGKVNLSWKPSEQSLLYAQVAQGFRPGFGTDQLPGACAADAIARGLDPNASEVKPDKVVDYEVGAKGVLFGGRVRGGAALYRNDWKDIQLAVFLPCGFKQSANAGDVVIYGAELEGAVNLTEAVEIGGNLSYIHDRFTQTLAGMDAQVGDPILNVPTWSASGYAQYSFQAFGMDGMARLDVQHTGSALLFYDRSAASAPAPLQFRERPALTLVNARIQLSNPDWTFAVFGRNLTNEEAITGFAESISANIPYRPRFAVNGPRVLGVEITRRF